MSNFKQNISKFIKGLENKITDKIATASNETIKKNASRDSKCKGLNRKASSKCCAYCMEHEDTYSLEEVKAGKMGGRHEACKCKVTPVFDKPENSNKKVYKEEKSKVKITDKSFGRKFGKHAREFGLDPKNDKDRATFRSIILRIINEADEKVAGTWRDRPNGVDFYIREYDVVVAENGRFITILKDGVRNNERVKSAMLKSRNRSYR